MREALPQQPQQSKTQQPQKRAGRGLSAQSFAKNSPKTNGNHNCLVVGLEDSGPKTRPGFLVYAAPAAQTTNAGQVFEPNACGPKSSNKQKNRNVLALLANSYLGLWVERPAQPKASTKNPRRVCAVNQKSKMVFRFFGGPPARGRSRRGGRY